MLGHKPFYHKTFRKAVTSFAKVFLDIHVIRYLKNGDEERRIKVPLTYGPKEKYIYKTLQDPELDKAIKFILPRMAFQITSVTYIPERKKNQTNMVRRNEEGLEEKFVYTSTPYMIGMSLSIISKTQSDAQQIVEQILPFFRPEYTISINALPELELKDDVPIVLKNITTQYDFDGDWQQQRNLIWTLDFEFPLNFYGPITSSKLIKQTQTDVGIPSGDISKESIAKTPRVFREKLEIVPLTANKDDDYDILNTIEYFDDGLRFNPVTLQDEPIEE